MISLWNELENAPAGKRAWKTIWDNQDTGAVFLLCEFLHADAARVDL
jgi:hypothetical protein